MLFLAALIAHAHAEWNEGIYTIVAREGGGSWANAGVLLVDGASTGPVPNVASTETYCTAESFRWPQVIAAGSPPVMADWLVLPLRDVDPGTSINCADHVGSSTKSTFSITPCSGGGCPAVSGAGPWTAQASSTPITSLKPGLYHVTSHREDGSGNRTTGTADVFVRPTADPAEHLETWCYASAFVWPHVSITVAGTTYERVWWEYKVDAVNSAPASVTCPGGTTKVEYKYKAG